MKKSNPIIKPFFHESTNTICYVVTDPKSGNSAIIDSCLDYDHSDGSLDTKHAEQVMGYIQNKKFNPVWILETHVHADHLSAAPFFRKKFNAKVAIGSKITKVQHAFGLIYNAEHGFRKDGSQFDHLFKDGDTFEIGNLKCEYITTPGHTPACGSYKIENNIFVGDTLFMHDFGTARCDFPGGNARDLYKSIKRILSYPEDTNLWMCHDYLTEQRKEYQWKSTVSQQRKLNPHVRDGILEDDFVRIRQAKDSRLGAPKLIVPSIQVNMRAGEMPPPEDNGISYLKVPVKFKERS